MKMLIISFRIATLEYLPSLTSPNNTCSVPGLLQLGVRLKSQQTNVIPIMADTNHHMKVQRTLGSKM
jgi:hypothetical protein